MVCSKYGEKLSNTNDFVREQKIENYRFSHSYKFSLIVQNSIHTVHYCSLFSSILPLSTASPLLQLLEDVPYAELALSTALGHRWGGLHTAAAAGGCPACGAGSMSLSTALCHTVDVSGLPAAAAAGTELTLSAASCHRCERPPRCCSCWSRAGSIYSLVS